MVQPRTKLLTCIIIYLLLLTFLTLGSFFLPDGVVQSGLTFEDATAKTALDTLTNLQEFVGKLNTALYAACGWLVVKGQETDRQWSSLERYSIMLVTVAGATSYYGLYLSRISILEMVSAGVIDPMNKRLQGALAVQYYGFLVGAALIGLVFIGMINEPPRSLLRQLKFRKRD